jgi:hypothetical protein
MKITAEEYRKIKIGKKVTPETEIKNQIKAYLDALGIFHFPIMQGMGSYRGIPDRIAISHGISYYIEIKSQKGVQSTYQKQFQSDIERSGGIYILARGIGDLNFLDKRAKLY